MAQAPAAELGRRENHLNLQQPLPPSPVHTTMSHIPDKRKTPDSIPGGPPYAKRSRISYADDDNSPEDHSPSMTTNERPRNNPLYGQKSAFPGLDVEVEDELFYGPAEDGMEYLRMVRSEANSLPVWVTAPKTGQPTVKQSTTKVDDGDGKDVRIPKEGTYVDGIFVGPRATEAPAPHPSTKPNETPYPDTQLSYYNLLHHRFLLLRSIMKCTPPPSSIAALDESHPISLPRHAKAARKEWRRLLLAVDPQTVQLACMDMDSVLSVLGIMARLMSENVRSGDAERVRRIGAWAWGLLGKCREVGQLGTEEVGEIRDLGKRAVKILHKMREDERNRTMSTGQEDDDDDQESEDDNLEDSKIPAEDTAEAPDYDMQDAGTEPLTDELEAAKARLQAKIQGTGTGEDGQMQSSTEENPGDVVMQTRAMLDMIITVVGEYYGQKDLLKEREIWEDCTEGSG